MDMKLELIAVPVSDVDRAKRFYTENVGGHLGLGGANLAASLIDLIDEFRIWVNPVAVGGGKPFFPVGRELQLRLVEHRSFASGALYLRYRQRAD